METGSILLLLAVILLIGLYVAQPFLGRRNRRLSAEAHEISTLMAERDRVVNALQELDFDFKLNKIPAEDYPVQRAALLEKGADILKRLDELTPSARTAGSAEDRVEKAVAARRADSAAHIEVQPIDDDSLESLIASRRSNRKERSGGFCPRCGKPVLASDRFCPSCGKSIS